MTATIKAAVMHFMHTLDCHYTMREAKLQGLRACQVFAAGLPVANA